MRNRLLAALAAVFLLSGPAIAGSATIIVKDANGTTHNFDVVTDSSGNYRWNNTACDGSAGANCAAVKAASAGTVDYFGNAITPTTVASGAAISSGGGGRGTQYYFNASTGTDNGNCTSASAPCRTISQANALTYPNGATINLAGGTTFSGTILTLNSSNVQGSLTVNGNWGGGTCNVIAGQTFGCAVIQSTGSQAYGIQAHDLSNLTIENLRIIGSGNPSATMPTGCGYQRCPSALQYDITVSHPGGTVAQSNITIQNVESIDFSFGINVNLDTNSTYSNPANYVLASNVTINNNYAHGSTLTTPTEYGILVNSLQNSLIQGNLVTNIGGNATQLNGSGILVQFSLNTTVQYNVAHDTGYNVSQNGGIWSFGSQSSMFQFNKSYNAEVSGYDGEGFDLDCGVNRTIVQYNYSHHNWGPGYLHYTEYNGGNDYCNPNASSNYAWGGAIIWANNQTRYNISEGDNYGWDSNRAAFDYEVGNAQGANGFYNNTVYTHAAPPLGTCLGASNNSPSNMLVYNNICYNDSGSEFIATSSGIGTLDYNDYYRTGTTPNPQWSYVGNNYTVFSNWTGAGYDAHGKNVDPSFLSTPPAGTLGSYGCYPSGIGQTSGYLACPTPYKLTGGALIGAGANLSSSFTLPTADYWGNTISGYNIGAY